MFSLETTTCNGGTPSVRDPPILGGMLDSTIHPILGSLEGSAIATQEFTIGWSSIAPRGVTIGEIGREDFFFFRRTTTTPESTRRKSTTHRITKISFDRGEFHVVVLCARSF